MTSLEARYFAQLRQGLCRVSSLPKRDETKLFKLSGLSPELVKETTEKFPTTGYTVNTPLYNLLVIIIIRAIHVSVVCRRTIQYRVLWQP